MIPNKSLGLTGKEERALEPKAKPNRGRKKWKRAVVKLKKKIFFLVIFKGPKVRDREKASILRAIPTKRIGKKLDIKKPPN